MAEHDAGDNKPLPLSAPDTDSAKSTPTTFFPENALQLQLDLDENGHDGDDEHDNEHEHENGRGREPSPHSELQRQERQQERQQFPHQQQQQQQQQQPPSTPFAHVRFHSRVRITSGLRHSRGTRSLDSSDSDSPSSSISAPLRYRSRDADPRGPLGQRISRLAAQALQKRRAVAAAITTSVARDEEYAPLRPAGFPVVTYGATGDPGPRSHDADGEQRSQDDLHSGEIAFGRWPWRGLNRHWWRWQIESTLCCCCSDSEADE